MTAMSRNAVMSQLADKQRHLQPTHAQRPRLKMVTMTLMAPMMEDPHDVNGRNEQETVLLPLYWVDGGIEGPARTGAASPHNGGSTGG